MVFYEAEGTFNISIRTHRKWINTHIRISIECSNIYLVDIASQCLDELKIKHSVYTRFRYGKEYKIIQISRGLDVWKFLKKIKPVIKNTQDFFKRRPRQKRLVYLIQEALKHVRDPYRKLILKSILKDSL